jgi:hypothetical protein
MWGYVEMDVNTVMIYGLTWILGVFGSGAGTCKSKYNPKWILEIVETCSTRLSFYGLLSLIHVGSFCAFRS